MALVRRTGWVALVGIWLVVGQILAVAAPVPPTGGTRIELLTHDARRPLHEGDRIAVTLRGSAGGSSTFDIFGVAANVGMRELRTAVYQAQPAVYNGAYFVRPVDAARSAALLATLTIGGQEVIAVSERLITIDTRRPSVTARQPKPGARLPNDRPNIVASFLDTVSGVNPGAVRLVVNGQNVTARASVSETFAAFNPETPFPPGPVRVQLTVTDRAGNSEQAEWSFTVAPTGDLIKSVTIGPATPLTQGDILTVVAAGAPGGRASFTVQGMAGTVAMRESRTAGLYFGTMAVGTGPSLLDAPLLVTLEKDGRRATVPATAGVTIVGTTPAAPTVQSPTRPIILGDGPPGRLVIRGRSVRGFRVLGRLTYVPRSASTEDQNPLGEILAVATAEGAWAMVVGPVIVPSGARVFATLTAIDPVGRRSPPTTIEVAQATP